LATNNSTNISDAGIVAFDGTATFTGLTFTTGSVPFGDSTLLTEDNSNLFWDNTDKRLGIGTNTPTDTLVVMGDVDIIHTSVEANDHALEIECDAAGFNDVKAIEINYVTGALAANEEDAIISINIDETLALGGELFGVEILSTAIGGVVKAGLKVGTGIGAVSQSSGVFGDADNILNKAVDVTAALADGGAGNISVFVADNDTVTIGDAAKFEEIEVILGTEASGAGIAPTFEYSTGVGTWAAFSPVDGTNGLRNTGNIAWQLADVTGWIVSGGLFLLRWTRTRNNLSTTPIIDEIQISVDTEFLWDKNGDVNLNSLSLLVPLTVPNGGTGLATITDGGIMLGSGTGAITPLGQATNGQLPIGSTGADPVLATITAGAGIAITNAAGSITVAAESGGFSWSDASGAFSPLKENGYFITATATGTLPASPAQGDVIQFVVIHASQLLTIQAAGSQIIQIGNTASSAGGTSVSTQQGDAVELVYRSSDVTWWGVDSTGGWDLT